LSTSYCNTTPPLIIETTYEESPTYHHHHHHQEIPLSNPQKPFTFYSQYHEDKFLLEHFFQNSYGSSYIFLEMGALDGTLLSNTKFFQDSMGWSGYLIEPSSTMYHQLLHKSNRCAPMMSTTNSNSGKAVCLQVAGCEEWMHVDLIGAGKPVGGINLTMTEAHLSKFKQKIQQAGKENVLCGPMNEILKMVGVQRIDLFSLDVEGGELNVLRKFDFDTIKVHVLIMERAKTSNQDKNLEIEDILTRNGFKFYSKQGLENIVYVNERNRHQVINNNKNS
jgi:hypothetical protein